MSRPTNSTRKGSLVEEPIQKIIVGVAGGSAAGKTTLCENIFRQMAFDRHFKVEIISLDSFYKSVDKTQVNIAEYNFDHPNALDFDLAYKTLKNLIESNDRVEIPQYSFIEHARLKEPAYIGPANIIFFEGLMAFYDKRIRDLLTYKIFINCDDDIRLCRRLKRDTAERGRSVISVLEQYNKFVKNAFRDFILPYMVYADIIIPGFRNNRVSVDFIVQHIKNMARRITFKERAVKTRTFIFGESEIYDLECSGSYETTVSVEQESFLVFPTENEHKRELQFFLTSLLSEIFTVDYFHEIYMNQFIKILKTLLKQLISLKNFKPSQMEVLSVYNLQEILKLECNKYPVKVIFFPVAELTYSDHILGLVKAYLKNNSKTTFIILNAFCDMSVPNMIYKFRLSNVIMINLFVIANDKRFREIMTNNISATTQNFDWFLHNHEIANEGTATFAKEFNFYRRTEAEIAEACYHLELAKQTTKIAAKTVDEENEKVGIVHQFNIYGQQHANLSGYHALSCLVSLQSGKNIQSKETFIENYHLLANSIGRVDYDLLQKHNIAVILSTKLFEQHNNIGVLLFSFKHVQNTISNSEEQVDTLQQLFNDLDQNKKQHIYVIIAVEEHYALLKITKTGISFYDSKNTSLRDILNGTYQHGVEGDSQYIKRVDGLREALNVVLDLLQNKARTVKAVVIEKRIQDIVDSFQPIKDEPYAIRTWLDTKYTEQDIRQNLLKVMRENKLDISESHKQKLHNWLSHPMIHPIFPEDERKLY